MTGRLTAGSTSTLQGVVADKPVTGLYLRPQLPVQI